MDDKLKENLLAIAYFGMLLDTTLNGYKDRTATIKATGEVFTFEELKKKFKNK